MPNFKSWVFTLNNPHKQDRDFKQRLLSEDISYLILAKEKGESGTPHYQGYVTFREGKSFSFFHNGFPKAHWEKAIGSRADNMKYCTKEDASPLIIDDQHQGERTDLRVVYAMIQDGLDAVAICDFAAVAYMRNHNAIDKLIERRQAHRTKGAEPPLVYVLYGDAGAGKTRHIYDKYDSEDIYTCDNANDWTGYTQQKVILLDDIDCSVIPYRRLLRLLDRYPCTMNKKYGSVKINSPKIYITSEVHPRDWYAGCGEIYALLRRITKIVYYQRHKSPVVEIGHAVEPPLEQPTHPDVSQYGLP